MEDTLVREIITIDEEKCNGCGECVPNCPEGALQIIDGKARLVGELLCDGLGACVGRCPQEAMTIERWPAEPYDESKVMANVVPKGVNTILAHLGHLKHAGAADYLEEALRYIRANDFPGKAEVQGRLPEIEGGQTASHRPGVGAGRGGAGHPRSVIQAIHQVEASSHGCPGSRSMAFSPGGGANAPAPAVSDAQGGSRSMLTHWPVQLHLINPAAPHFQGCDLLLAADCTAFSLGGFHGQLLAGRKLTIACPKLDQGAEIYVQKLTALIDQARINTLTVAIMEVPCCGGLVHMAQIAAQQAKRKVPIKQITVGISGEILEESWL